MKSSKEAGDAKSEALPDGQLEGAVDTTSSDHPEFVPSLPHARTRGL